MTALEYGGGPLASGARVALSPSLDLWMRGARFGVVIRTAGERVTVKLDRGALRPVTLHRSLLAEVTA